MSLKKNSVADTIVRCHSRATRAQRVLPKLGGVSLNGLQIPPENFSHSAVTLQIQPESFSHSAVTNKLTGGYQLTRILTLRSGSKNQISGIWRNSKFGEIFFKELDRTCATRKLRKKLLRILDKAGRSHFWGLS